jgi:hypothetical protein
MHVGDFAKAAESYTLAQQSAEGSLADLMAEHARRAQFYANQGPLITAEDPTTDANL